jgi:hypothetical protein
MFERSLTAVRRSGRRCAADRDGYVLDDVTAALVGIPLDV